MRLAWLQMVAMTCMAFAGVSYAQLSTIPQDDGPLGGIMPRLGGAQNTMGGAQNMGVPSIVGGSAPADRAAQLDREAVLRQAVISSANAANLEKVPAEPSEFQKYVQERVGYPVNYFGANFFANAPTTN